MILTTSLLLLPYLKSAYIHVKIRYLQHLETTVIISISPSCSISAGFKRPSTSPAILHAMPCHAETRLYFYISSLQERAIRKNNACRIE